MAETTQKPGDPARPGPARLDGTLVGLMDASPDGVALVDDAGMIAAANLRLSEMTGRTPEELVGAPATGLAPSRDRSDLAEQQRGFFMDPGARWLERDRETHLLRADESECPVEIWAAPVRAGDRVLLSLTIRDVTAERDASERLRTLADQDPLTGLPNRRRFEQAIETEIPRAQRYGGGSLVLIDVDNFKYVNDTSGHRAGDELIKTLGKLLADRLRETDLIARIGGDEFAALLPETPESHALEVARDLVELVGGHPFTVDGRPARITISAGVAPIHEEKVTADDVLVHADIALYEAKDQGRNQALAFNTDSRRRVEARLNWQERIRKALDEDLFVPHFQPILDMGSRAITHYEVLVRMVGDAGEIIPPDSFLPTAERFGLIRSLDRWVIEHAIDAIASHSDRPELNLEINLSGKSIDDPELIGVIASKLEQTGVEPSRLIFEVTETAAIANLADAKAFGNDLAELGCGFALDDFGTGFASFYYLKHLPVTHVKIDGDFIRTLPHSPVDQLVVQAIVGIARGMGLKTVAEYVEDAATLELLHELGVDYSQGFEIGRPQAPQPPARIPTGDDRD